MAEDCWYGFFSPRFPEKIGLSHAQVQDFIRSSPPATDVVTFSPQPDMGAFFLNVFEQNEVFDPGFLPASEAFLASIGMVHTAGGAGNGFAANRIQQLFCRAAGILARLAGFERKVVCGMRRARKHVETSLLPRHHLHGAVQRKVFLMERIASLLLTVNPAWKVRAYNTFACAWSASKLGDNKQDAVISDALKMAIREQGYPQYLSAFAAIRDKLR